MTQPKITTLTPWFGSNRMLAEKVGELLVGKEWVGVPFAGGMSELLYIKARTLVVNDLHRLQINLARIVAHEHWGPQLIRRLRRRLFHPDELSQARSMASAYEQLLGIGGDGSPSEQLAAAEGYFVATWMNRSAKAGTKQEFGGGLPLRWEAGGGDSAVRYFSAVESLKDWRKVLRRANFSTLDVFEFLAKCQDKPEHGVYCDPPFFGPGDAYRHTFTESQHRALMKELTHRFERTRVVCRFYDVPLIRELYREAYGWRWLHLEGRKQTNEKAAEVLIYRN